MKFPKGILNTFGGVLSFAKNSAMSMISLAITGVSVLGFLIMTSMK